MLWSLWLTLIWFDIFRLWTSVWMGCSRLRARLKTLWPKVGLKDYLAMVMCAVGNLRRPALRKSPSDGRNEGERRAWMLTVSFLCLRPLPKLPLGCYLPKRTTYLMRLNDLWKRGYPLPDQGESHLSISFHRGWSRFGCLFGFRLRFLLARWTAYETPDNPLFYLRYIFTPFLFLSLPSFGTNNLTFRPWPLGSARGLVLLLPGFDLQARVWVVVSIRDGMASLVGYLNTQRV